MHKWSKNDIIFLVRYKIHHDQLVFPIWSNPPSHQFHERLRRNNLKFRNLSWVALFIINFFCRTIIFFYHMSNNNIGCINNIHCNLLFELDNFVQNNLHYLCTNHQFEQQHKKILAQMPKQMKLISSFWDLI